MQLFYKLSGPTHRDPAMEDALYEIEFMLREGSIVDASIISAPSSTKNESGQRDRIGGPPNSAVFKKTVLKVNVINNAVK